MPGIFGTIEASPNPTTILFVDGASFQKTIDYYESEAKQILSRDFSHFFKKFDRIFYYDALPSKKPGQSQNEYDNIVKRKELEFDRIDSIDNCHVRLGSSKWRRKTGLTQKGVDIHLAVEAYENVIRGNADEYHFIVSDLDFLPLFEAIVRAGTKVHCYYDTRCTSKELLRSADIRIPMHFAYLYNSILNEIDRLGRCYYSKEGASLECISNLPIIEFEENKYHLFEEGGEYCFMEAGSNIVGRAPTEEMRRVLISDAKFVRG